MPPAGSPLQHHCLYCCKDPTLLNIPLSNISCLPLLIAKRQMWHNGCSTWQIKFRGWFGLSQFHFITSEQVACYYSTYNIYFPFRNWSFNFDHFGGGYFYLDCFPSPWLSSIRHIKNTVVDYKAKQGTEGRPE